MKSWQWVAILYIACSKLTFTVPVQPINVADPHIDWQKVRKAMDQDIDLVLARAVARDHASPLCILCRRHSERIWMRNSTSTSETTNSTRKTTMRFPSSSQNTQSLSLRCSSLRLFPVSVHNISITLSSAYCHFPQATQRMQNLYNHSGCSSHVFSSA